MAIFLDPGTAAEDAAVGAFNASGASLDAIFGWRPSNVPQRILDDDNFGYMQQYVDPCERGAFDEIVPPEVMLLDQAGMVDPAGQMLDYTHRQAMVEPGMVMSGSVRRGLVPWPQAGTPEREIAGRSWCRQNMDRVHSVQTESRKGDDPRPLHETYFGAAVYADHLADIAQEEAEAEVVSNGGGSFEDEIAAADPFQGPDVSQRFSEVTSNVGGWAVLLLALWWFVKGRNKRRRR